MDWRGYVYGKTYGADSQKGKAAVSFLLRGETHVLMDTLQMVEEIFQLIRPLETNDESAFYPTESTRGLVS
jgi:hypothetical protein